MAAMEEMRRRLILLVGLYIILYMLAKHVVDIPTLLLEGEWVNDKLLLLNIY